MHRKIISKEVNRTNSEHTSIHKQTGKRNKHIRAQHRTAHDVKINGVKRDNQEEKMKRQKELLRRATHSIRALLHLIEANAIMEQREREREGANKKRTSLMLKFVFDSNSLCFLFHFSMKTNSNWWREWRKKHRTPNRNGERKMKSERELRKEINVRQKIREIFCVISVHRIQPACNYVPFFACAAVAVGWKHGCHCFKWNNAVENLLACEIWEHRNPTA